MVLSDVSSYPVRKTLHSEANSRSSPAGTLLKVAKARWEPGAYPWRRPNLPEEFLLRQIVERAQWGLCQESLKENPVPLISSAHAEE